MLKCKNVNNQNAKIKVWVKNVKCKSSCVDKGANAALKGGGQGLSFLLNAKW